MSFFYLTPILFISSSSSGCKWRSSSLSQVYCLCWSKHWSHNECTQWPGTCQCEELCIATLHYISYDLTFLKNLILKANCFYRLLMTKHETNMPFCLKQLQETRMPLLNWRSGVMQLFSHEVYSSPLLLWEKFKNFFFNQHQQTAYLLVLVWLMNSFSCGLIKMLNMISLDV